MNAKTNETIRNVTSQLMAEVVRRDAMNAVFFELETKSMNLMEDNGLPYHNNVHVQGMLDALEFIWPTHKHKRALRLAICYHDIVYVPGSGKTLPGICEKLSGQLFEVDLMTAMKSLDEKAAAQICLEVTDVSKWIQGTTIEDHMSEQEVLDSSTPAPLRMLLDLDLLSLAAPYDQFEKNQHNIILEMGLNVDKSTLTSSAEFLNRFLNKKNIYRTEQGRVLWELRARENILRYIKEVTLC